MFYFSNLWLHSTKDSKLPVITENRSLKETVHISKKIKQKDLIAKQHEVLCKQHNLENKKLSLEITLLQSPANKHELASSMCELLDNFERKLTHMTYKPPFCVSLTKEVWAK